MQEKFRRDEPHPRIVELESMTLKDVALIAATSSLVVIPADSKLLLPAATFVPRGSLLIVVDSGEHVPRADRDFVEAASHYQLHWLTKKQMLDAIHDLFQRNIHNFS